MRKPKSPDTTSGGIDEIRAAANYCRSQNQPVIFILANPDDLPTARNILKDASIVCDATVTLLLTPNPIEGEKEPIDAFFDAGGDVIDELEADPDIVVASSGKKSLATPSPHIAADEAETLKRAVRNQKRREYMARLKAGKNAAINAATEIIKGEKDLQPLEEKEQKRLKWNAYMKEYMRKRKLLLLKKS